LLVSEKCIFKARAGLILGLGLVFVIGIALAAFLLPVWDAHLRLRDA